MTTTDWKEIHVSWLESQVVSTSVVFTDSDNENPVRTEVSIAINSEGVFNLR